MGVDEVMAELESLGSERLREMNHRGGWGDAQLGVRMGDIRAIGKRLKRDLPLAHALWATGIAEAQLLATLLLTPAQIDPEGLEAWARTAACDQVANWLSTNLLKKHRARDSLRGPWRDAPHPMVARLGWSLTAHHIEKGGVDVDAAALLDRIEAELVDAHPLVQWTMNMALVQLAIQQPAHRARALELGEALGVYRDYPTPKGCTSPFAPEWIGEMVRRQG